MDSLISVKSPKQLTNASTSDVCNELDFLFENDSCAENVPTVSKCEDIDELVKFLSSSSDSSQQSASKDLENFTQEIDELKLENRQLRESSLVKEREIADYEFKLSKMMTELLASRMEMESLKKQLAVLEAENTQLQKSVEALKAENMQDKLIIKQQNAGNEELMLLRKELAVKRKLCEKLKIDLMCSKEKVSSSERLQTEKRYSALWGLLLELAVKVHRLGLLTVDEKNALGKEYASSHHLLQKKNIQCKIAKSLDEISKPPEILPCKNSNSPLLGAGLPNGNHTTDAIQKPIVSSSVPSPLSYIAPSPFLQDIRNESTASETSSQDGSESFLLPHKTLPSHSGKVLPLLSSTSASQVSSSKDHCCKNLSILPQSGTPKLVSNDDDNIALTQMYCYNNKEHDTLDETLSEGTLAFVQRLHLSNGLVNDKNHSEISQIAKDATTQSFSLVKASNVSTDVELPSSPIQAVISSSRQGSSTICPSVTKNDCLKESKHLKTLQPVVKSEFTMFMQDLSVFRRATLLGPLSPIPPSPVKSCQVPYESNRDHTNVASFPPSLAICKDMPIVDFKKNINVHEIIHEKSTEGNILLHENEEHQIGCDELKSDQYVGTDQELNNNLVESKCNSFYLYQKLKALKLLPTTNETVVSNLVPKTPITSRSVWPSVAEQAVGKELSLNSVHTTLENTRPLICFEELQSPKKCAININNKCSKLSQGKNKKNKNKPKLNATTRQAKKRKRKSKNSKKKTKNKKSESTICDDLLRNIFLTMRENSYVQASSSQEVHSLVNLFINPSYFENASTLVYCCLQQLVQYRQNPILAFFREEDTDLLPPCEAWLVDALLGADKRSKLHLRNLLPILVNTLHQVVLTKCEMDPLVLASFCRVLAELCRRKGIQAQPLSLCFDLIQMRLPSAAFLVASMAGVWAEFLQPAEAASEEDILLLSVLLYGVKKQTASLDLSLRQATKHALSRLLPKIPALDNPRGIMLTLMDGLLDQALSDQKSRQHTSALAILAAHEEWCWIEENLLQKHVIPDLHHFKDKEEIFCMLCQLYVLLLLLSPESPSDETLLQYFKEMEGKGGSSDCAIVAHIQLLMQQKREVPKDLFEWLQANNNNPRIAPIALLCRRGEMTKNPANLTPIDVIK